MDSDQCWGVHDHGLDSMDAADPAFKHMQGLPFLTQFLLFFYPVNLLEPITNNTVRVNHNFKQALAIFLVVCNMQ